MEKDLKRQILETILWFDMFDYPLKKEDFGLDVSDLENLIKDNKIQKKDGYYFLSGREELIEQRKKKEKISAKKMKKVWRAVNWLKNMPFVRAIILTSNLSYNNADEKSDIDFLIISEKNRIWITRFFTTGWFILLNLRPRNGKNKDKFCFSFYLDESDLNLEKTRIKENDLALKYFLLTYKCLYSENNVWEKFMEENDLIFNKELKRKKIKKKKVFFKKNSELLFNDKCEKFLKKLQLWYMPKKLKEESKIGNNKVIINDKILKLHLNDKRVYLNEKLKMKSEKLINK
jgi:hypothetical protein